jgi:hypothetical protein
LSTWKAISPVLEVNEGSQEGDRHCWRYVEKDIQWRCPNSGVEDRGNSNDM